MSKKPKGILENDSEALTNEKPEIREEEVKVLDDKDRRNPQYIPKRGVFYEHDDRIDSDSEEGVNSEKRHREEREENHKNRGKDKKKENNGQDDKEKYEKKKNFEEEEEKKDVGEKFDRKERKKEANEEYWSHDKFTENEQAPKSKDELVFTYGYDIRNEDSAPRPRRRRRYGRGPNKYTRNWENEKSYIRSSETKIFSNSKEQMSRNEEETVSEISGKCCKSRGGNHRSSNHSKGTKAIKNNSQSRRGGSGRIFPNKNRTPCREESLETSLSTMSLRDFKSENTEFPKFPKRYSSMRPSSSRQNRSLSEEEERNYSIEYRGPLTLYDTSPYLSPHHSSYGGGLLNITPHSHFSYIVPPFVPTSKIPSMQILSSSSVKGPNSSNILTLCDPSLLNPSNDVFETGIEVRDGLTYYNTNAQTPVQTLTKRPKAVIPIVDPANPSEPLSL